MQVVALLPRRVAVPWTCLCPAPGLRCAPPLGEEAVAWSHRPATAIGEAGAQGLEGAVGDRDITLDELVDGPVRGVRREYPAAGTQPPDDLAPSGKDRRFFQTACETGHRPPPA